MTASGIKFHERLMRLARRVAPIRVRGRRPVPGSEKPAGPKLVLTGSSGDQRRTIWMRTMWCGNIVGLL